MNPPKKLLVVEDDKLLREALALKLEKANFTVTVAMNGQEALAKLQTFKPDLIMLDIMMPVMDGLTALKEIHKNPDTKDIPVIMMTNINEADQLNEAMEYGVKDYLVKSDWRLEDVVKKINEKLHTT